MGGFVGCVSCWLVGALDYLWPVALIGAMIGLVGGVPFGLMHRKRQSQVAETNLATMIGATFGLVPALLILLGGVGVVQGKFSGLLMMGAMCAGPMIGLMIGGLLDRFYEGTFGQQRD